MMKSKHLIKCVAFLVLGTALPVHAQEQGNFYGMDHIGLGQAQLDLDRNGQLVVSNIGSSGLDGVSIDLGDAGGYGCMLSDIAEPLGAFREMTLYGSVDGVPGQPILTRRYEVVQARQGKTPGILRVSQDSSPMGATLFDVKAFDIDGNLLHAATLPSTGLLWEVPTFPTHSLCIIVEWTKGGPQDVAGCLDEGNYAGTITFGDGVGVDNVNSILVQAVDATGQIDFMSRVDDVAAGIPEFTLMDSTLGQFGNFHLALGQAQYQTCHDCLIISNIGSSGDDGVETHTRGTVGDQFFDVNPLFTPGAKFQIGGRGLTATGGESDIGVASLVGLPTGDLEVHADYSPVGASLVRVEVYDLGSLVGSAIVPGGGPVATVSPAPGGGPPVLTGIGAGTGEPGADTHFWGGEMTWLSRVRFTTIDTQQFLGDELRLVPENHTVQIEALTAVSLTAANMPSFQIHDLHTGGASSAETICPDDPNDFQRFAGGVPIGDATQLCASDDDRLRTPNLLPFAPVLPYIRIETWAHAAAAPGTVDSISYVMEGGVTALVPGGQNPDTLRTSIRNYSTGSFELVDQRATASAFFDELVIHNQTTNAPDYVQAADGEVRVRVDAFDPGGVLNASWELRIDLYLAIVNQ